MLDKFWRNLSALIRFFCTGLFTNVNGKAAGEILANFKKINILNFMSVLIFFFGFVRSKYLQVPHINVFGFSLQKARLQAWF